MCVLGLNLCPTQVGVLALTIFLNISKRRSSEIVVLFGQISGQDKPSSNANMPVTPRLNPLPTPKPPHLMRSSDTPASQQTVVNGRIAGYGISPSHSYDTHSQGEQFLFWHFWNVKHLMLKFVLKAYNSLFYQHHQVGYQVED